MALHLPFCTWKMRRTLNSSLLATDATPSSGGGARAEAPPAVCHDLWRACEVRGEAVRLDRSGRLPAWDGGEAPKEPSLYASTVAESLHWKVTSSYHFRNTHHINLQEARALKRELEQMTRDVCLNDSRVVCGAVAKGRSSSFRLNGILRSMIPFLTLANVAVGILWVETDSNPADYPSRFKPIPPPRSPPSWLASLGCLPLKLPGLEIFAGSARITQACLDAGWPMLPPVDALWGLDALDDWIDTVILAGRIGWMWLAPPCGSFSALRNLDYGGPLRPKHNPLGDEANPEVAQGNLLWRRALQLARLAMQIGIPFFLEHPRGSKAWLLRETQQFLNVPGVSGWLFDWCQFHDEDRDGPPNRKPTRVVGTGGWMHGMVRRCPGGHVHGAPLRGSRAKLAGAYPHEFCRLFARSLVGWYGEASQRGSFPKLSA